MKFEMGAAVTIILGQGLSLAWYRYLQQLESTTRKRKRWRDWVTGGDPTEFYECVEAGKQTNGAFMKGWRLFLRSRYVYSSGERSLVLASSKRKSNDMNWVCMRSLHLAFNYLFVLLFTALVKWCINSGSHWQLWQETHTWSVCVKHHFHILKHLHVILHIHEEVTPSQTDKWHSLPFLC